LLLRSLQVPAPIVDHDSRLRQLQQLGAVCMEISEQIRDAGTNSTAVVVMSHDMSDR